jgi:hypothetical protein
MITVECSIIDLKTRIIKGKYNKIFTIGDDFNKWYAIVKTDCDTIINIMRYNPEYNPGLKDVYDAKLLRVTRENVT